MSFSYNAAQFDDQTPGTYPPSTRGQRWQLRMMLSDTNSTRPLMQDEELDWMQTQETNIYMMAARVCEILLSRFGGISAKRISQLQIQFDTKTYRMMAADFRARAASNQVPYAGGISVADKAAQQADGDWVAPSFSRRLHDHPSAPQTHAKKP
jgi:hypothetical protein